MSESTQNQSQFAVLYVDDEEMALKYFRRALGGDQPCFTATSVAEALEVMAQHSDEIGVLVTDQRMPNQTGVDLLKRVRSDWPDIVRVLTTAYSDLEDAIEAVNRGEIFRYINKPWDVRQLRAEIRQAMDVFHLKRERALLMREKLSVWQRLVEVNRIRDLVVMGGSFTHLHNVNSGVAAYLTDNVTGNDSSDMVDVTQLDLWTLTEKEIDRTLGLAGEIVKLTSPTEGRDSFDERADARQLLEEALPAHHQIRFNESEGSQSLLVNSVLARRLLEGLYYLSGGESDGGARVHCQSATLPEGQPAAEFTFRTTADGTDGAAGDDSARRLACYLIAYHHGGRLEPARDGRKAVGWQLTLPTDPTHASVPEPESGWLQRVLARLEQWG
ncbi:MAG: response regulator [Ectothiorhodospiraceae bacterium]|jgi:two-component system probable response regulator PhcQ